MAMIWELGQTVAILALAAAVVAQRIERQRAVAAMSERLAARKAALVDGVVTPGREALRARLAAKAAR